MQKFRKWALQKTTAMFLALLLVLSPGMNLPWVIEGQAAWLGDDGDAATVIYSMQADTGLDDFSTNGYTDVLQKSGSPTIAIVNNEIHLSDRTEDYFALDIKLGALPFRSGYDYTFTVTGKTDPGSTVVIGETDGAYEWKTNSLSDSDDGTFTLVLTKSGDALLAEAYNYRIQTSGSPVPDTLEIHSIVITESGDGDTGDTDALPAGSELIYELFATTDVQLLSKTTLGSGGTIYLQDAGAQFCYDPGPPETVMVVKDGSDSWRGLDVKGAALQLESGAKYWIKVTGGGVAAGSSMTLAGSVSANADDDGNFTLLAGNFEYTDGNIRINSTSVSEFEIYTIEIYKTNDAPDPGDVDEIDDIFITFAPGEAWTALPGRSANPNNLFQSNGTGVAVEVVDDRGRTEDSADTNSLKVTKLTENAGNYQHWVRMGHVAQYGADEVLALPKGSFYTITAWFYVPSEAAAGKTITGPQIFLNNNNSGTSIYPGSAGTIEPDTWTRIVFETPIMTVNLDSISFRIGGSNDSTYPDYWYIDDVSIQQTVGVLPDPPEWDLTLTPLKSVYEDYFLIGNIIANPLKLDDPSDPSMADMYQYHYNAFTAENNNKPQSVVSAAGVYNKTYINKMADWCNLNNFKYIAHTLVWHSQSSSWLHGTVSDPYTRALAKERMEEYIGEIAGAGSDGEGLEGKPYSWDVVNEAFLPGINEFSGDWKDYLRKTTGDNTSPWYAAYANGADESIGESGADYIYDAFVFTRQADPDAILYYNDFNDEEVGKSQAIAAMVKDLNQKWEEDPLYDDRLLIEGIGLQSHYNTNISTGAVENAIAHYISENPGVKLSVTELDITIAGTSATVKPTEEQYIKQALMYAELFEIYKKYAVGDANQTGNPKVIERVTFWGTDDGTSWRSVGQAGGTGGYPTLFKENYNAKEAYYAVIDPETYIENHTLPEIVIKEGQAAYTDTAPDLDGTSSLWENAVPIIVDQKAVGDSAATGVARLLWDDNALYVRVDVTDSEVDVSSANVWEKDSVEVFISETDFRGAYNQSQGNQYRITANGLRSVKSGGTAAWDGYAEIVTDGYFVEYKIPWANTLAAGDVIGFDIQINDPPPAASRPQLTWNDPDASGYNTSEKWGRITLAPTSGTVTLGTLEAIRITGQRIIELKPKETSTVFKDNLKFDFNGLEDLDQMGVTWESNNKNVTVNPDGKVMVDKDAPPSTFATIRVRSALKDKTRLTDFAAVRVVRDGTDAPRIGITSDPIGLIRTQDSKVDTYTIIDDLKDGDVLKTITLSASEAVTVKISDIRVAKVKVTKNTQDKQMTQIEVNYVSTGTATLTVTSKADATKSVNVELTVRDRTPKLPESSVIYYENSVNGIDFLALPSDNMEFDDLKVVANPKNNVTAPFTVTRKASVDDTYTLKIDPDKKPVKNTKYTVLLQAKKGDDLFGDVFALTVNYVKADPNASLKTAALNLFFDQDMQPITVNGKNLPEIKTIKLKGDLDANFEVAASGDRFFIRTKAEFGEVNNGTPKNKGDVEITYDLGNGAAATQTIKNFTVKVTTVKPKLTVSPATQLVLTKGTEPTATFYVAANSGITIESVGKVVNPKKEIAANAVIHNQIANDNNSFTVTLDQSAPNYEGNKGTYKLQLEVVPAGARKGQAISVNVTVKTVEQLPEKPKPASVTVKAEKGNIDLVDRANTRLIYVPKLADSLQAIQNTVSFAGPDAAKANEKLTMEMINGNAVIMANENAEFRKDEQFVVQLEFTFTDGSKTSTPRLTVKPANSIVKHSIPKVNTLFQSRTKRENYIAIDMTPISPAGAAIAEINFKEEQKNKDGKVVKYVNNPGEAFWYSFDQITQTLYIWIEDGSRVKPGPAALTFEATYIGQGAESKPFKGVNSPGKEGDLKPAYIKVPITIAR